MVHAVWMNYFFGMRCLNIFANVVSKHGKSLMILVILVKIFDTMYMRTYSHDKPLAYLTEEPIPNSNHHLPFCSFQRQTWWLTVGW